MVSLTNALLRPVFFFPFSTKQKIKSGISLLIEQHPPLVLGVQEVPLRPESFASPGRPLGPGHSFPGLRRAAGGGPVLGRGRGDVVDGALGHDVELDGRVALVVGTHLGAGGLVVLADSGLPRGDVDPLHGPVEHLQAHEGLVEGHLVARLVDADKGERPGLSDLAVHHAVRGGDVDEPGVGVARGADVAGHHLAPQPVAVEVGVAKVHDQLDAAGQELLQRLDRADLAVVVARAAERVAHGRVALGVVDVRPDRGLHAVRVEVVDVVRGRERVGHQVPEVVLVAAEVDVVEVLDLVQAKIVGRRANLVDPSRVAVDRLVVAVAGAVEVVVPLV